VTRSGFISENRLLSLLFLNLPFIRVPYDTLSRLHLSLLFAKMCKKRLGESQLTK